MSVATGSNILLKKIIISSHVHDENVYIFHLSPLLYGLPNRTRIAKISIQK